ncbi:MAG: Gfo/Idh/MocA family oxidoreductase [Desulfobacterales bacterium]|jgi:predicted dehydrogenase
MKLAVIGCGYWGPNLIRNFFQIPYCTELVCCDLDHKKLERMRKLYPAIHATNDVDDILKDPEIQGVAIATPVHTHHVLGEMVLQNDKHLFVEKPLAASTKNCARLIELAREKGKVLMVGHTFEYTAAVNKIKEIIDSGELGNILYVSSTRVNLGLFQPDINVIWDLAPHDISIINYVLGKTPLAVNAQGTAHFNKSIEDVATVTLNYDNGVVAFLHVSWLDPNKIRRTTFVGSKKMLVYNDIEVQEKIKIYDKGVEAPPYYDTYAEFQFSYRYGDIYIPKLDEYEPLRYQLTHFLECVQNNMVPRSDGYCGLKVVSALEAAEKSIKSNGKFTPIVYKDLANYPILCGNGNQQAVAARD